MRHQFNVKVQTDGENVTNRTIFTAAVAGFSVSISWPLSMSVKVKQAAALGTPYVLLRTIMQISSQVKLAMDASVIRMILRCPMSSETKTSQTLIARMLMGAGNLESAIKVSTELVVPHLFLKGGDTYSSAVKIAHSLGTLYTDRFYKLKEWDYVDPEGDIAVTENRQVLSSLDVLTLDVMEKIKE
ncbi:MAG: hypothetical protein ACI4IW_05470 [Oscillospiraceae bacterium]